MTDRLSVDDVIEKWLGDHPSRRSKPRPKSRSIYFEVQSLLLLFIVFSLYHFPPMLALPHADVLILDMTHGQDVSWDHLTDMLSHDHLSWVIYDSVTVDIVRLIPTGGYHFIILWGHSGPNNMALTEPYSLFTHVLEQLTGQVGRYSVQGNEYFSVAPGLVLSMRGTLRGSIVLLMGCNTLTQPELAYAFLRKGSSLVIGWRGLVSVSVTSMAAISLFDKVLREHEPVDQALVETNGLLDSVGVSNVFSSLKPQ